MEHRIFTIKQGQGHFTNLQTFIGYIMYNCIVRITSNTTTTSFELFTISTKLPMLSKKLPPLGLKLMITRYRVQCSAYWANLALLVRLRLSDPYVVMLYFATEKPIGLEASILYASLKTP